MSDHMFLPNRHRRIVQHAKCLRGRNSANAAASFAEFVGNRRIFLAALGAGLYAPRRLFAEELVPTARQTEGPFYPNKLPLDTDNDLLVVNDAITPAVGEITHLTGRVLDGNRNPVKNATVEIWQVDNNGIYLHTQSPQRERRDENFQGFGRFLTGSTGEFYFRTIKPVPYTFGILRTPHIHFIVAKGGKRILTTQIYVKGHPLNERDRIFQNIGRGPARESVLVDFRPVKESRIGELTARFNIVIGETPEDRPSPRR